MKIKHSIYLLLSAISISLLILFISQIDYYYHNYIKLANPKEINTTDRFNYKTYIPSVGKSFPDIWHIYINDDKTLSKSRIVHFTILLNYSLMYRNPIIEIPGYRILYVVIMWQPGMMKHPIWPECYTYAIIAYNEKNIKQYPKSVKIKLIYPNESKYLVLYREISKTSIYYNNYSTFKTLIASSSTINIPPPNDWTQFVMSINDIKSNKNIKWIKFNPMPIQQGISFPFAAKTPLLLYCCWNNDDIEHKQISAYIYRNNKKIQRIPIKKGISNYHDLIITCKTPINASH